MMRNPYKHIIVITQENRSFDQLFTGFPHADPVPRDLCMPSRHGPCVRPYPVRSQVTGCFNMPNHSWDAIHAEWNHGDMNGFVRVNGRDTMGYFPEDLVAPYWKLARQGVLLDHYFCSVLGPTLPNRLYLVSGSAAGLKNDPSCGSTMALTQETVFDQLEAQGVSWTYYVDNYRPDAFGRFVSRSLMFCPLFWFPRFMDRESLRNRIRPFQALSRDLDQRTLPDISFVAPGIWNSGHPPLSMAWSMTWLDHVVKNILQSPQGEETLIVINFDEAGGFFDHVAPPRLDADGPGMRVPCLLLAHHLTAGRVVHEGFDHTSVLRMIEECYGLPLLGQRIHMMPSLSEALLT